MHAVVLCWGMRSGVHNTRLLAASADVRLVRKYVSSMKERPMLLLARNVLALYRTRTILYDTCLMDEGRIFDRI